MTSVVEEKKMFVCSYQLQAAFFLIEKKGVKRLLILVDAYVNFRAFVFLCKRSLIIFFCLSVCIYTYPRVAPPRPFFNWRCLPNTIDGFLHISGGSSFSLFFFCIFSLFVVFLVFHRRFEIAASVRPDHRLHHHHHHHQQHQQQPGFWLKLRKKIR